LDLELLAGSGSTIQIPDPERIRKRNTGKNRFFYLKAMLIHVENIKYTVLFGEYSYTLRIELAKKVPVLKSQCLNFLNDFNKNVFVDLARKFDFDSDPESDPEIPVKSDLDLKFPSKSDPEIIFSDPTQCILTGPNSTCDTQEFKPNNVIICQVWGKISVGLISRAFLLYIHPGLHSECGSRSHQFHEKNTDLSESNRKELYT